MTYQSFEPCTVGRINSFCGKGLSKGGAKCDRKICLIRIYGGTKARLVWCSPSKCKYVACKPQETMFRIFKRKFYNKAGSTCVLKEQNQSNPHGQSEQWSTS